jgi:membrane protein implicated in regulation of membrane protease activity
MPPPSAAAMRRLVPLVGLLDAGILLAIALLLDLPEVARTILVVAAAASAGLAAVLWWRWRPREAMSEPEAPGAPGAKP